MNEQKAYGNISHTKKMKIHHRVIRRNNYPKILYNEDKNLMRPLFICILRATSTRVMPLRENYIYEYKKSCWAAIHFNDGKTNPAERNVLQWQWFCEPLCSLHVCWIEIWLFDCSPQLWHRVGQSPSPLWMVVTCCLPTPLLVTHPTWWPRRSSWTPRTSRTYRCSPATPSAWCRPGRGGCSSLLMLIKPPRLLCLCKPRPLPLPPRLSEAS